MKSISVYVNTKYFFAIFLFALSFWGIRYTSDWEGYVYAFYHTEWSRDIAFSFLSDYFIEKGWQFRDLFHFHITLMAVLYATMYRRLKVNPIIFVALTVFMNYIGFGNQIRYYVAFSLALNACFSWYKQKYVYSICFFVIAMLFHYTVIIFFALFVLMTYLIKKNNWRRLFAIICLLNVILFLVVYKSNFMLEEQYATYKNTNLTSSFVGGLFNLTPLIIPIFYLRVIARKGTLKINEETKFLYILCISTFPLFLLAIYMQIMGSRLMMALLPFYLCFFAKVRSHSAHQYVKAICDNAITLTLLYFILWRFIIPSLFGINGPTLVELQMMLKSYTL